MPERLAEMGSTRDKVQDLLDAVPAVGVGLELDAGAVRAGSGDAVRQGGPVPPAGAVGAHRTDVAGVGADRLFAQPVIGSGPHSSAAVRAVASGTAAPPEEHKIQIEVQPE